MSRVISALKFMYNMERFATQVYRTERGAFTEEVIIERLIAAAENEQQHVDLLQKHILELQANPSHLGFIFQTAGRVVGLAGRVLGKHFILRTDILVEKRAIKDYRSFLKRVAFDEETVALIEKIIADEQRHVETWENSIKLLQDRT